VVLPGLLLTVLFDQVGQRLDPALDKGWWYQDSGALWRFVASLSYVNEPWFASIRPFSNGPFWSLGYEFWYYVLYGAFYYYRRRQRILLVTAVVLMAGPKILILLPAWLMGVWTYRFNKRQKLSTASAWVWFLSPLFIYAWLKMSGIRYRSARSDDIVFRGRAHRSPA
jgi:hypothetical protein